MRKFIAIYILILLTVNLYSDAFSDWKKKQSQAFEAFKQDEDSAFRAFLEKEWQEFQVFKGIVQDETPKIEEPPVSDKLNLFDFSIGKLFKFWPKNKTEKPAEKSIEEQTEIPIERSVDLPVDTPVAEIPSVPEGAYLKLNYFGSNFIIPTDQSMEIRISIVSESSIASFWREMSMSDYSDSLKGLEKSRDRYSLNDWGYAVQVHRFAESLYKEGVRSSGWNSKLLTWFLLTKSGISARVAYRDNDIYLMIPSSNTLYGHPFFTIDNTNYYIISFEEDLGTIPSLYTYQGEYPDVGKMTMDLDKLPELTENTGRRRMRFTYREKNYTFDLEYEKQVVDFLERYPHTDNFIYFDGGISTVFSHSVEKAFFPILQGKSEAEAVNIILRFVQTAFEYQTDDVQFGREKWLFPDETIYYPYADCEDRSILFAWMVKTLTGLDVVGLDWPGHIATAVAFNDDIPGDYMTINGSRYTICDPTYINADIGMMMDNYRGVGVRVIEIK
jgi:hypothetical protein